jgi:2-polyprenyl-3-methyl-5-hydroxy-6-metoxy-1,4-benzoquinol methylase
MLENYKKHNNGVIEQITKIKFNYNKDYINNSYNTYGELGMRMAHQRLGYLIGSLGFIPESLLDVGYGNGDFLKVASSIIPLTYGNDISTYPIPENSIFIDDPYNISVDVVTFFDVLEHFHDIYDIKLLNTKYILISVPNCHYFSDNWFDNWKHRRPEQHFWHFNEESLINFMDEIGYDVINTTNIEDTIRDNKMDYDNILTGVFKKRV